MRRQYGKLLPVRGSVVTISVQRESDAEQLQKAAEEKMKTIKENLDDGPYLLLDPNGTRVTDTIPGTVLPFSLKLYKKTLQKNYQRITLYICPAKDFYNDCKLLWN